MIRPPACIFGSAWRVTRNVPLKLMSVMRQKVSSTPGSGSATGVIRSRPALLTRTSIRPIDPNAALTAAASVMSQGSPWHVAPVSAARSAATASMPGPEARMKTSAPAAAKPRATARPMPRLAPVTSTVSPEKS